MNEKSWMEKILEKEFNESFIKVYPINCGCKLCKIMLMMEPTIEVVCEKCVFCV